MRLQKAFFELSDEELTKRFKDSGELEVLNVLFQRHTSLVYGVCVKYLKNREESKDAVMQLFEKLIVSLREHEVRHFKSWLYTTARNHCLMALRSLKGKHFEELPPFLMESDTFVHQEYEEGLDENLSKLEKCMDKLVDEQKRCIQLFYLKEKCYQEITELTGFDYNKDKRINQKAKRNLKIRMDKYS